MIALMTEAIAHHYKKGSVDFSFFDHGTSQL